MGKPTKSSKGSNNYRSHCSGDSRGFHCPVGMLYLTDCSHLWPSELLCVESDKSEAGAQANEDRQENKPAAYRRMYFALILCWAGSIVVIDRQQQGQVVREGTYVGKRLVARDPGVRVAFVVFPSCLRLVVTTSEW